MELKLNKALIVKDKIITFRLSNNDLLILKSKCEDKNIKLSIVIRNALLDYLNRI